MTKGNNSNIPVSAGMFFIAPNTGSQITLKQGDKVFAINEERFCKTTCSYSFSQGSIDISDDCSPGATMGDGVLTLSGSLSGLFIYDDQTQEFSDITDMIINRFLDIVEDDGNGTYTLYPREDSQMYLLTLLNSGAKAGQIENWLFAPININSMAMGLENNGVQKSDLQFTLGDGKPSLYKIPVRE